MRVFFSLTLPSRLEAKLNARKAKVADLKHKQEEAKLDRSKEKQKLVDQLVGATMI